MNQSQQKLDRAEELANLGRIPQALEILYPLLGDNDADQALVHGHIGRTHLFTTTTSSRQSRMHDQHWR